MYEDMELRHYGYFELERWTSQYIMWEATDKLLCKQPVEPLTPLCLNARVAYCDASMLFDDIIKWSNMDGLTNS